MKRVPKAIYMTAGELEQRIRERESDALRLPPNTIEHREIMQEIARLRIYAEAKRWLAGPTKQQA
jgi:hypothetical protein